MLFEWSVGCVYTHVNPLSFSERKSGWELVHKVNSRKRRTRLEKEPIFLSVTPDSGIWEEERQTVLGVLKGCSEWADWERVLGWVTAPSLWLKQKLLDRTLQSPGEIKHWSKGVFKICRFFWIPWTHEFRYFSLERQSTCVSTFRNLRVNRMN